MLELLFPFLQLLTQHNYTEYLTLRQEIDDFEKKKEYIFK